MYVYTLHTQVRRKLHTHLKSSGLHFRTCVNVQEFFKLGAAELPVFSLTQRAYIIRHRDFLGIASGSTYNSINETTDKIPFICPLRIICICYAEHESCIQIILSISYIQKKHRQIWTGLILEEQILIIFLTIIFVIILKSPLKEM